jgi:CheY-like chemotaxis protein
MEISKISVLIIDDSPHIRILLTRFLKDLGFEKIEAAENGILGLAKVKTLRPDIIFLDGIMPEMDGLTTLGEIKKTQIDSFVIITTSLSSKENVLKFKESGADYYLLKPFTSEKIKETMERVLALMRERNVK